MPINRQKLAAFDVETGGELDEYALQPYRLTRGQAWINSSATARFREGRPPEIDRRSIRQPTVEDHRKMLVWAAEHDITLCGWNMAFDVAWLIAQGLEEEVNACKFLDVMLLWQHLEREPEYEIPGAKKRPWTLKQAVGEYWPGMAGYENGINYAPQTEREWRNLLKYNELDCVFTLMLAVKFYSRLERLSKRQLRNALIEARAIVPVAQSIVQGLVVNQQAAAELGDMLDKEIALIKGELAVTGVTEKIMGSPTQLQKLLYDEWQLPVLWKTPKGAPSTDKTALYLLAGHDPRVSRIKSFREHKGNRTKFCQKVLESVTYNEDGRTRPAMRIYGTYTGRATFASSQGKGVNSRQTGFAIHQMKNGPEYRGLVGVPEGFTLVEWDASGQEYRWMAEESGDDTMRSLCMAGEDPHSYMGAGVIGEQYSWVREHKDDDPVAKQGRKMGKMGNLSCVAASTLVVTDSGTKRITDVTVEDAVWDGAAMVQHDGVVYQGDKHVISYGGLRATPDHLVLWLGGWVPFGEIAIGNLMGFGNYVESQSPEPVYDILNCGPRNRFVANGLIVHNCQFRIGAKKLHTQAHVQFGIPITEQEADHVHRTYHGTYPGVKQYWKRKIAEARRKGYAETLAGRRVLLNGSWMDRSVGWKLESTAVNFPIQGVGADQKYLAIQVIQPYLRHFGGYFYFELHDGIYAILPDAVAMKAGLKIRDVLSNLPYQKAWGFTPSVPMPFDMKIGKDWGSLREVKA